MATLSIHCPPRPMPSSLHHPSPSTLSPACTPPQPFHNKGSPHQVSLSPLRIKSQRVQKPTPPVPRERTRSTTSLSATCSPMSLDHSIQLHFLSQMVDDAMYSTTIDALADSVDSTIEKLCLVHLEQHQSLAEPPVPSSFSEGYPIHSPTRIPTNPTLAALLFRRSSTSSDSSTTSTVLDYDTLAGFDLDTPTILSLFPAPPSAAAAAAAASAVAGQDGHASGCSSLSATLHLSSTLTHCSDRDSTDSLLSAISTTSMSSVSTLCTTVSLSESDNDPHDPTDDDPHYPLSACPSPEMNQEPVFGKELAPVPCTTNATTSSSNITITAAVTAAAAGTTATASTGKKPRRRKSASKRQRQKLSMKRHWEVPQQACVIPPIFDKRYFEDDKAEIPKSIEAMEAERQRARQEQEEEQEAAKRRRRQEQEQQQEQQILPVYMADMSDARDGGKDGSNRILMNSQQQHQGLSHHTLASLPMRSCSPPPPPSAADAPLRPGGSSSSSSTFLVRRPRQKVFLDENTPALPTSSTSTSTSTSASPSWETHQRLLNISSRVSTMEASMRAASRVLEQRAQWLDRMDRQLSHSDDEKGPNDVSKTPRPRLGPPLRSKTSPCLVGGIPAAATQPCPSPSLSTRSHQQRQQQLKQQKQQQQQQQLGVMDLPPLRTSSMRTLKGGLQPSPRDRAMMPLSIPSWARRIEMDPTSSLSLGMTGLLDEEGEEKKNNSKAGYFWLSNGDDEVLTRGDDDVAQRRRRRRWRCNTEDRHAEWMETIKAGRWGQDDPWGWGNRFQRLKQHFQTVTGRPFSPEVAALAGTVVMREEQGEEEDDEEEGPLSTCFTRLDLECSGSNGSRRRPSKGLRGSPKLGSLTMSSPKLGGLTMSSPKLGGLSMAISPKMGTSSKLASPKLGSPRHWFPSPGSLRAIKENGLVELPQLSKLWQASG